MRASVSLFDIVQAFKDVTDRRILGVKELSFLSGVQPPLAMVQHVNARRTLKTSTTAMMVVVILLISGQPKKIPGQTVRFLPRGDIPRSQTHVLVVFRRDHGGCRRHLNQLPHIQPTHCGPHVITHRTHRRSLLEECGGREVVGRRNMISAGADVEAMECGRRR
ncbi:hypothetical protein Ccrd_009972 [Cynara cardunculus var. scolymus]|uniref:Uncharacterized protein n=1 Tax=Cynara cardunculus var. scolymus TaxID=59895 RepID=A0A103YM72_CYNCS|nr:hypothetical protein Ccrd_009972 [Cynara cardunculus var. scolymus]